MFFLYPNRRPFAVACACAALLAGATHAADQTAPGGPGASGPDSADARVAAWQPTFADKSPTADEVAKIEAALPSSAFAAPARPRRVLVYSATAGFRHKSIPHGKLALTRLGETTGAFTAVVSDDSAHFEPAALRGFDAVVLLSPTMDFFTPGEKALAALPEADRAAHRARHSRLVDSLLDYVRVGGGVVGIHAATDACYHHAPYGEMMGGYFDGHPWSAGHHVTVVVEDPAHALMRPVFAESEFRVRDEIYQFKAAPYTRERLRILLRLDPSRSDPIKHGTRVRADHDFPISWVQRLGEGRVFYSSLGHNPDIYWHPVLLRHYLAGIQFATGDLPADTTPSAALPHAPREFPAPVFTPPPAPKPAPAAP